jgi:hypothetical protein
MRTKWAIGNSKNELLQRDRIDLVKRMYAVAISAGIGRHARLPGPAFSGA